MKLIVKIEDIRSDGSVAADVDFEDGVNASEVYYVGEYDDALYPHYGFIKFVDPSDDNREGWHIGCADSLRITFSDGTDIEFNDMDRQHYHTQEACDDAINRIMDQIKRILIDDTFDDPETDMPDIF